MTFSGRFILLLLTFSLSACVTGPPRYRGEALVTLERAQKVGAENLFPAAYRSTLEALGRGESLLMQKKHDDAERYFYLALLKGELLEQEVGAEKARLEEAQRLAEERKKAELERLAREEAQRLARIKAQAEAEIQAHKEAVETERKKVKPQKEIPLVSSYTVRRGESLPLIASQPQVYGDRNYWPLIYRANRDQISDPRHIWPGQVLRIPRNLVRDDISEARRYAQERPLR